MQAAEHHRVRQHVLQHSNWCAPVCGAETIRKVSCRIANFCAESKGAWSKSRGATPTQVRCSDLVASLPGSPLAPTKNKNGGGEPGIDSYVISRHDAVALLNNLKRHSREDREVAAKYSSQKLL